MISPSYLQCTGYKIMFVLTTKGWRATILQTGHKSQNGLGWKGP